MLQSWVHRHYSPPCRHRADPLQAKPCGCHVRLPHPAAASSNLQWRAIFLCTWLRSWYIASVSLWSLKAKYERYKQIEWNLCHRLCWSGSLTPKGLTYHNARNQKACFHFLPQQGRHSCHLRSVWTNAPKELKTKDTDCNILPCHAPHW